jgi:hypothetical protein
MVDEVRPPNITTYFGRHGRATLEMYRTNAKVLVCPALLKIPRI